MNEKRQAIPCKCPHCGESLQVDATVTVTGVDVLEWQQQRWEIEEERARAALEAAGALGVLDSFRATVEDRQKRLHNNPPKATAKLFWEFIKSAKTVRVSHEILDALKTKCGGGHIDVIQNNGIAAALSNGRIFQFFSWDRAKGATGIGGMAAVAWIRGRNGYVPSSCQAFANALRQSNPGAFDTAGRMSVGVRQS